MTRLRTLVGALAVAAAIGAGAAWAADGSTTPSTTTPGATTTTPSATTPRAAHHCPNMGNGSSSSGASYMPSPTNL
jgi:hypothetical protein